MSVMDHSSFNFERAQIMGAPWLDKLEAFKETGLDLSEPSVSEIENRNLFNAKFGNTSFGITEISEKEKGRIRARENSSNTQRLSATANAIDLSNINLNSNLVSIASNGILQIDGRDATLEEKLTLEDNSQANSVGLTQEELDMESFIHGETDVVPETLAKLAEEKGLENPTMDDYKDLVQSNLPVHISSRIIGGGLDVQNSNSLLSPAPREALSSVDGGVGTGLSSKASFLTAADGGAASITPPSQGITPPAIPLSAPAPL